MIFGILFLAEITRFTVGQNPIKLTELYPLFDFNIFPTFELLELEGWFVRHACHSNKGKVPLHSLLGELFSFLGCINPCLECRINDEECELLIKNKLTRFFFFLADVSLWSYAPFTKVETKLCVQDISKSIYAWALIFGILFWTE